MEALIEKARIRLRYDVKDDVLAALILRVANKDIDVESMTSLQMEALTIATKIKEPPPKEWKKRTRFKKQPKKIELGAFPDRGIDSVTAHVIMLELTLNGKVQERLQGVTYEISLTLEDERSSDLDPITEAKIATWTKANSTAAYKRRRRMMYILKEQFDSLSGDENKRIMHSVISLARGKEVPGSYVLPKTEVDPLAAFSQEHPEVTNEFNYEIRNHFLTVLSGERDVTIQTGYQNGNAANPSKGRGGRR